MRELEPTEVWSYFEEILKIPRLSRNEEKVIQYLERFAAEKILKYKKLSLIKKVINVDTVHLVLSSKLILF